MSVYTGMGIRYGGDGFLAYLPRLGEAIKIHFNNGRPFVFSTRNQEKVLEILNQKEPNRWFYHPHTPEKIDQRIIGQINGYPW